MHFSFQHSALCLGSGEGSGDEHLLELGRQEKRSLTKGHQAEVMALSKNGSKMTMKSDNGSQAAALRVSLSV